MSTTDHSDSRASLNHTPSSTQKSQKILQKPQFKLCFPKEKIAGKSETRVASIDANFITPKFYTNDHDNEGTNEDNNLISDMVNRQMEEEKKGPRDLYNSPMLSSQSYGWWYDKPLNSNDPRFNFHKNTSDMVRVNAFIRWEDKKLRNHH